MVMKSDPQIGIAVDTGDRITPAGCKDNNSKYAVPLVDADGHLQIDVLSGGGGGTQYADGAVRGTSTGNIAMVDDGTNIQSMKGDSSGRPAMNIEQVAGATAVSGSGTATGALRVELPTNGTGVIATVGAVTAISNALPAGNNNIGDVDIASGTITTVSTVTNLSQLGGAAVPIGAGTEAAAIRVTLPTNGTGVIATVSAVTAITNALPAGTNAIGKLAANSGVDIGDVDVTSISAGSNLIGDVSIQPRTTNGWLIGNFTSGDTYTALTATAQVIKASAGKFGGYYIYNPNAAATYVLIYNIAAASVTVGTSTALLVFCIPATSAANLELVHGIPFSNAGWSIAAATTGGGNTAPATAMEAMVWYL